MFKWRVQTTEIDGRDYVNIVHAWTMQGAARKARRLGVGAVIVGLRRIRGH